ncbi:hypothetical protein FH972_000118 [Carpinus fangiana]|uniref:Mediator of RNA polymerase II transcription subunit 11 n=1 Tax=Carpinus fangiana TaxID=176857 RepID=A0A5N6QA64_9ROSI|nr:hypothetical protein FH972_000118 [Carpinus fangiana]KAE7995304.1 hypothetical protein FH972_000118 [Carpinus fangiana]
MDSPSQNTSLQRLQNVEKRVVRVLELAGGVMDELASPTGPRKDFINNHCLEFMQLIKVKCDILVMISALEATILADHLKFSAILNPSKWIS